MAEGIGILVSVAVLAGGLSLALQQRGSIPWGGWLTLLLMMAGGLGLLYSLVIGAGHRRDHADRRRSS